MSEPLIIRELDTGRRLSLADTVCVKCESGAARKTGRSGERDLVLEHLSRVIKACRADSPPVEGGIPDAIDLGHYVRLNTLERIRQDIFDEKHRVF